MSTTIFKSSWVAPVSFSSFSMCLTHPWGLAYIIHGQSQQPKKLPFVFSLYRKETNAREPKKHLYQRPQSQEGQEPSCRSDQVTPTSFPSGPGPETRAALSDKLHPQPPKWLSVHRPCPDSDLPCHTFHNTPPPQVIQCAAKAAPSALNLIQGRHLSRAGTTNTCSACKTDLGAPPPKFLSQQFQGRVAEFAFLTSSRRCWCY